MDLAARSGRGALQPLRFGTPVRPDIARPGAAGGEDAGISEMDAGVQVRRRQRRNITDLCLLALLDVRPLEAREDVLCVLCMSRYRVPDIFPDTLPDAVLLLLHDGAPRDGIVRQVASRRTRGTHLESRKRLNRIRTKTLQEHLVGISLCSMAANAGETHSRSISRDSKLHRERNRAPRSTLSVISFHAALVVLGSMRSSMKVSILLDLRWSLIREEMLPAQST